MDFDREGLIEELIKVKPAVSDDALIKQHCQFWFHKNRLYGFNGGLGIRLDLKSDLDCGLPGKQLLGLLSTSDAKKVSLKPGKKGVVLTMGKSNTDLVAMPPEDRLWRFPEEAPKKDVISAKLTKELLLAFERLGFIKMAKGGVTQTVHQGVTMIPAGKEIEVYATDSHTMAQVVVAGNAVKNVPTVIIPWSLVDVLMANVEPGTPLSITDEYLMVAAPGFMACHTLLDASDIPNFSSVIQTYTGEVSESVNLPKGIDDILRRVLILAGSDEPYVSMAVKARSMSLTGSYKYGVLNEKLTTATEMTEDGGTYQAEKISRALQHADAFSVTKKAFVLYGGDDFLYVVASHQ